MAKDIIEVEDTQLEEDVVVTPEAEEETEDVVDAPKGKYGALTSADDGVHRLSGMYKNWFLDYASYVILERAVPHLEVSSPCSAVSFTP